MLLHSFVLSNGRISGRLDFDSCPLVILKTKLIKINLHFKDFGDPQINELLLLLLGQDIIIT